MTETNQEMYIGIGLGRMRKEKGWSQEKLSHDSKLGYRTIQNLEYNKSVPSGTTLKKLADVFELKVWEFMKEIEDEIIYKNSEQENKEN